MQHHMKLSLVLNNTTVMTGVRKNELSLSTRERLLIGELRVVYSCDLSILEEHLTKIKYFTTVMYRL